VLAHEFGHYAGGDTRIGAWTWRTRATISHTIASLHDEDSWGMRIVQQPFIWYGNAFLRITNAISRRQEFAADAWAARIAGRDANVSTLRKLHRLGPAYNAYWDQEVTPALKVGAVPPFGPGFARFAAAPRIAEACDKAFARELEEEKSDPYSSHPTLAERLAAVEVLPPGAQDGDATPAVEILDGPEQLERATLDWLARNSDAPPLESISWQDVGDRVYRRIYEEMVAERPRVLDGVTTATIADALRNPGPIARRAFGDGVREDTHPIVQSTLGAAFVLALTAQGWTIDAPLAEPIACRRGDDRIEPFTLLDEMASGEMSSERWDEVRAAHGIEDAPLARSAAAEKEVAA
jgi:hypothetical protein